MRTRWDTPSRIRATDLSGADVARKLLILARQIGLKMDLEDIEVERLVPPHLSDGAFSPQFFTAYAAHDAEMQERVLCARSRGAVLRYVGTLEGGRAHAELREFSRDHPFATTAGTDNVVALTTTRYSRTPLILQGPGRRRRRDRGQCLVRCRQARPLGAPVGTMMDPVAAPHRFGLGEREQLARHDREYLIHPLHYPSDSEDTVIYARGRGVMVHDIHGHEYIDALSGLWNVNVGHGRAELADAAAAQMRELAYCSGFAGSSNVRAIELAERLLDLTGHTMQAVFLTSGGAEANESAFKTARFYWKARGRPDKVKIIARDQAYHGLTLQTMSATGMGSAYWKMFEPRVPGFVHVRTCYPYRYRGVDARRKRGSGGGAGAGERDPAGGARDRRRVRGRADPRRRRHPDADRRLLAARARGLQPPRRAADRR